MKLLFWLSLQQAQNAKYKIKFQQYTAQHQTNKIEWKKAVINEKSLVDVFIIIVANINWMCDNLR